VVFANDTEACLRTDDVIKYIELNEYRILDLITTVRFYDWLPSSMSEGVVLFATSE